MKHALGRSIVLIFLIVLGLVFLARCSTDYKDISTPNGQQAVIDQANDYLTVGQCDQAISSMQSLYNSTYASNQAKEVYASAYACKAGMSFPSLIEGLQGVSDVIGALVKANPSTSTVDGHLTNFQKAAEILLTTTNVSGSLDAYTRPQDANTLMFFVQLNIISTILSELGGTTPPTGKRGSSLPLCGGACGSTNECYVEVAVGIMNDSLASMPSGAITKTMSKVLTAACAALGGPCPSDKDPTLKSCTAAEQLQGEQLIQALAATWST